MISPRPTDSHTSVPGADHQPETAKVQRDVDSGNRQDIVTEVRLALDDAHPDVGNVVERLIVDRAHPLDMVRSLNHPDRRDRVLATITELADARLLQERTLENFIPDNPGRGPLFAAVSEEVNFRDGGESRKAFYVAHCKSADAARAVGVGAGSEERAMIVDYGRRLADEVIPHVSEEVMELMQAVDGSMSIRAKNATGLLDKVARMSEGASGRPGRTDYQVGDVIDAVGARIIVGDTERLEHLLSEISEKFGTGSDGRVLEMENMYAQPKSHNPAYRVVPYVISVEVKGVPYTYELQLCSWRASIASDLEHNTIYKPYINPTVAEQQKVRWMQAEAAALDQDETRRRWI